MTKPHRENYKILVVDDEEGIRNVLKVTLGALGYRVFSAPDGEAGFQRFQQEQPQIVVTDIKMPGIDGIQLLKRIKGVDSETEVIMITGHGDMDLAVKSLQYEAADFITKPIDINVLETAIKKAIDRILISISIQTYMRDLEALVKEKDRKINESEKLVMVGQTIAGMSHAIKNIAGGLKGSSFVLEQGIAHENREYLKQGWEMMKGNIDKITKLSLDLLNYARTTRLVFTLENPNTPAREIMQLMKHRAAEKNIVFKMIPCRKKQLVMMDRDAIHSCLLNLVINAFDAVEGIQPPGPAAGVSLTVEIRNKEVIYRVEDNGCGMSENITRAVFNEFITTKGVNGTGFGLMTTKKIVEEHDGKIGFTTQLDKGACFTIAIPLRTR